MEALNSFLSTVNDWVWGIPLIVLIIAIGILMTVRTGLIQIIHLPKAIRYMLHNEEDGEGDVTSFGALCTALSATIGTGNIVGVATAIAGGGPGALFWMEVAAFFGMATKYAEGLLAVKYREIRKDGTVLGGPFYYIEKGMGQSWKWLAKLFAVFGMLVGILGIGTMTQINGITNAVQDFFDPDKAQVAFRIGENTYAWPTIIAGVLVTLFAALVIIGGIKSIAVVCEKLVPFMAAFYVLGCIVILGINADYILPAVKAILTLAFQPGAVAGGLVGGGIRLALQYGVARGLFSNESGMGSAPLVASAAQTRNPVRQALVSATGTFWTTVVVCLVTGLVLISTIMKNPAVDMANIANGGQMTTIAFAQIPYIGPTILVFSIITFAYSTILGWSYYGERAAEYLLGRKAILPYKVIFTAIVVLGPVLALDLVWTIADVLNALMAIPNLVAVLLLSGVIAKETRHYLANLDEKDTAEIPVVRR